MICEKMRQRMLVASFFLCKIQVDESEAEEYNDKVSKKE